jgi:hypothetical protein
MQGIKTIGIVSAVGDTFTVTQAGLVGLDHAPRSFAIAAWGLDEQIVAGVTAALGQRFQVQPVTYQREAFSAPERVSSMPGADLVREDPFKDLVRNHVSPRGLDAYVVVTKASMKYGTSGARVSGVGIIAHSAVFDSFAIVHALYVIRVIDGRSFHTIDKKAAQPVDNTSIVRLAGPSRNFEMTGQPSAFDPLPNESLKAAVADLISRSLEPTLKDLRMTAP